MRQVNRRDFLRMAAIGLGGWLSGCGRRPVVLTLPAPTVPPVPTSSANFLTTPPPSLEAGQLTPIDRLYIQSYSRDLEPALDLESYQLTLGGLAQKPRTLTWADLHTLPALEHAQTLECIGNPVGGKLIGNVLWKGVSLRAILERAAPQPNARYLVMSAADEYVTAVPLDLALDERSLLAFEANGEPLSPAHGFPLRVLLPGVYGQKQPKWITSLRLAQNYEQGTWEKQGWSDAAVIQINSQISYPPAGSIIPAGQPLSISGMAFADTSGMARVEVSVDGEEHWHEARLLPGPSPQVWTAWEFEWNSLVAGPHSLKARATDGNGNTQAGAQGVLAGVFPNGTSAIHAVVIVAA